MNLTTQEKRVENLLRKTYRLRDNDNKLVATIWWNELKERGIDPKKHKEILIMFAEGQLSMPDSITRVRRRLQETNPSLRGDTYGKRQAHQPEIIRQIREMPKGSNIQTDFFE